MDSKKITSNATVTERETHQDQLVTGSELLRDIDRTERERKQTSINTEKGKEGGAETEKQPTRFRKQKRRGE